LSRERGLNRGSHPHATRQTRLSSCKFAIGGHASLCPPCDALYLELNLVNINMDLRKHYLLRGQNENRRYRRFEIATSPLQMLRIEQRSFLRKF
jgi:hypothetical protein